MKILKVTILLLFIFTSCNKDIVDIDYKKITVNKLSDPVLTANDGLASDPTVLKVGDSLHLYYLDYNLSTDDAVFSLATSEDGINWMKSDTPALTADDSSWDKLIETPEVIFFENEFYLYYIGYPEFNFDNGIYASEIGLAKSSDGLMFERFGTTPIIPRGGSHDEDGITSPSVTISGNTFYMIYTGWTNITTAEGFLGQTGASSTDGTNWVKENRGIFEEVRESHAELATESDIVKSNDGTYYLVFTGENGIGLAKASNPFGPWDIYPEPIIKSEYSWESGEIVAPDAIIGNDKLRIWYTGVIGEFQGASIGYVEIDLPITW